MKFYAIPPNKHLELMDYGDSYFGLAHHYVQNAEYRERFLNIKKLNPNAFVTMDCGAAEHSLVTEEVLLDIVHELKPDEVIAPDVLFDQKQTLRNLYFFTVKMIDYKFINHTKIFGCPQGKTKEEWLECYNMMVYNPMVSTIGLSKIAVPKCWHNAENDTLIAQSRTECVQHLHENNLLLKPLHLLGMGEHYEYDFYLEHKTPNIRSSDSCYTILAAINGIDFSKGDNTRIPTTNDYFDTILTQEQIELGIKNIVYLKSKYKAV